MIIVFFLPYLWAERPLSDSRITNGPKTFHQDFNSQFYISHPNCFTIINRYVVRSSRGDIFKDM